MTNRQAHINRSATTTKNNRPIRHFSFEFRKKAKQIKRHNKTKKPFF